MIKKMTIVLLFIPLFFQAQDSLQMQEVLCMETLFDSLKTHPQTKSDELNMEKAILGKRIVSGMLYPKINGKIWPIELNPSLPVNRIFFRFPMS